MDIRFLCKPLKYWPEILKDYCNIKFKQEDLKILRDVLHTNTLSSIEIRELKEAIKLSQPVNCNYSYADYEKIMICAIFNGVVTLMPILEGGVL